MKYLKSYKIFEGKESNKYYIKGKYWDYELGYIWSPKLRTSSYYRDPSVCEVPDEHDGMTNTLMGACLGPMYQEYLGVNNNDDFCTFHPDRNDFDTEFSFITDETIIETKKYAIVEEKGNYITKEVENWDPDYKKIIADVLGRELTEKEKSDEPGDFSLGSWHVTHDLCEYNGIKFIHNKFSSESIIIKRDDIEKFLDLTNSCNYYRYKDKESQLLRIGDKRLKFLDIRDIFVDFSDNGVVFEDFNQISKNKVMVKFMKDDASFDDNIVSDLLDNIQRFEDYSGLDFHQLDLTRNTMMYINDSNKTWLLKDRAVNSYYWTTNPNFSKIEDLKSIGEMEYDVHLRPHAIYLIFGL